MSTVLSRPEPVTALGLQQFKAIIFDIDGTLLDSVDAHAESWVRTFAEFGVEANYHEVRSRIGEGADRLIPAFLPAPKLAARENIEAFRSQLFKKEYLSKIRPFPEVRNLLHYLNSTHRVVALGSSCSSDEIEQYKKIAEIADLVDAQATADDADASKPAPDIFLEAAGKIQVPREKCLIVGDTGYDGEAARSAGIAFVGLLCGGSNERELRESGAGAIFEDPAALLDKWRTEDLQIA